MGISEIYKKNLEGKHEGKRRLERPTDRREDNSRMDV
jgi:hypothetical protein